MGIELNFNEQDWERIERDWTLWWASELERPLIMMEDPFMFSIPEHMTREFMLEKPVDDVLDHYQTLLEIRHFYGDAWPRWWANFGPGIMAGFLGANVHCASENATVWFDVSEKTAIEDLHFEYDADNKWWRRMLDLTQGAVERWGDKVSIAHTDLGGNLDVLASFRSTEQLLYDVYDAPQEVTRLVNEITSLWLRYYDELLAIIQAAGRGTTPWAPIWSPGRCYMLQCDFCYMISPEMFERFVLPDLAACAEKLDNAFYHLDGHGQIRHLDMLLSMESLAGIQWIPGDGQPMPEEWLSLLKRIKDAGKLCQVYVSAEGAQNIVRELGGRGFALYIYSFFSSQEEADDFLRAIAADDPDR